MKRAIPSRICSATKWYKIYSKIDFVGAQQSHAFRQFPDPIALELKLTFIHDTHSQHSMLHVIEIVQWESAMYVETPTFYTIGKRKHDNQEHWKSSENQSNSFDRLFEKKERQKTWKKTNDHLFVRHLSRWFSWDVISFE